MEDCRYTASTATNLQHYFFNHHYTYRLHIQEDSSVFSYCRAYGILVSLYSLQCGHIGGNQCKASIIQNQQWVQNKAAARIQAKTFTIDGVVLKKVENFEYLGCQISSREFDALALFMNLAKAQRRKSALVKSLTWLLERESWFIYYWKGLCCSSLSSATVWFRNLGVNLYYAWQYTRILSSRLLATCW